MAQLILSSHNYFESIDKTQHGNNKMGGEPNYSFSVHLFWVNMNIVIIVLSKTIVTLKSIDK